MEGAHLVNEVLPEEVLPKTQEIPVEEDFISVDDYPKNKPAKCVMVSDGVYKYVDPDTGKTIK